MGGDVDREVDAALSRMTGEVGWRMLPSSGKACGHGDCRFPAVGLLVTWDSEGTKKTPLCQDHVFERLEQFRRDVGTEDEDPCQVAYWAGYKRAMGMMAGG